VIEAAYEKMNEVEMIAPPADENSGGSIGMLAATIAH